jgi:hypothetical protein
VKPQVTAKRGKCPHCAHSIIIPAATEDRVPEPPFGDLQPLAEPEASPVRRRRFRPLWIFVSGLVLLVVCLLAAQPAGVERSPFQFGVIAGPVIAVFGSLGFLGTTARIRDMSRSRLCYLGGLVIVMLGIAGLTANSYANDYQPHPLNALFAMVFCLGAVFSLLSAGISGVLAIPRSAETGEVKVGVPQALGGMVASVALGVVCVFLVQAVQIRLFLVGLIFAPILFIVSTVFLIRALGRK